MASQGTEWDGLVQRSFSVISGLTRTGLVYVSITDGLWLPLPTSGALSRNQLSLTPLRLSKRSSVSPLHASSMFPICCLGLDL